MILVMKGFLYGIVLFVLATCGVFDWLFGGGGEFDDGEPEFFD